MKKIRFIPNFIVILAFAIVSTSLIGCKEDKEGKDGKGVADLFTDSRDGKAYKTVKIGSQVWLAENLNYEAKGSRCYEDNPSNCEKYGRLYDWNIAKKVCPSGWYLPSQNDWNVLTEHIGGADTEGTRLKTKSGWNDGGNGTDNYGFSALPGGRSSQDGDFNFAGNVGFWWSASEKSTKNAYYRPLRNDSAKAYWNDVNKSYLFSVRCIQGKVNSGEAGGKIQADSQETAKKSTVAEGNTFTDSRDSKKYKTVKIGKQVWMAQNLDYHGSDGYLGLCYGDNPQQKVRKPENCQKYGRLYNWEEAMKACPKGWHLPSEKEWVTLATFVGPEVAGKKLKAKSGWNNECKTGKMDNRGRIIDACGTDEYGFSALPGGLGDVYNTFIDIGDLGTWWTATENNNDSRFAVYGGILYDLETVIPNNAAKSALFSVRCLKD